MASCSRNALSRSEDEAMLRRPDVDEVMEYGRALGFDLTPMEARMIQARMMDTIAALETFDEMRVDERRPPLRSNDRDPGRSSGPRSSTRISAEVSSAAMVSIMRAWIM